MPFWSDERLRQLEATLDAMDDAVMVIDTEMSVVIFNPAAEKLTGFNRREATGARCFEVCGGRFCRRGCDIETLFALGQPPEDFETPVLCKDGRIRLVRVRTVPLKGRGGRVVAAVRILRDVTERLSHNDPPARTKGYGHLVGQSPAMHRLYGILDELRDSERPLLLAGPPGTEKEWAALTVHQMGIRSARPFVRVLTAGAPPALVETQLFGPTGGDRDAGPGGVPGAGDTVQDGAPPATGSLCLAGGGTLFLDDVGELSPRAQARLLDYLTMPPARLPDAARLVAATSYDLERLAQGARFLPALARLLLEQRVQLPPLLERIEDLPLLVERLLDDMTPSGSPVPRLSPEALSALMRHPFPGNVAELDRTLRAATVAGGGSTIELSHLPPGIVAAAPPKDWRHAGRARPVVPADGAVPGEPSGEAGRRVRAGEPTRDELVSALEAHHWRVGLCARALGVDRTTVWRWMRRLHIERPV